MCVCACVCGENFARILKCRLYFSPWRALFAAIYAARFGFFFFNLGLKKYMCFSHLVLINTKEEIFYGQKCLVVIRCSSNSVPHSLK